MISERHKKEIVRRYHQGQARRIARYGDAGPITAPVMPRDADERAFFEVRDPLGCSTYRLGHLPTADEQAAGIDPRDDA